MCRLNKLIIFFYTIFALTSCQSKEERTKERLRIEAERQSAEEKRQEDIRKDKEFREKSEFKDVLLSKQDAYNEIIKYNKIYRWNYLFIKDSKYEPPKEFRNNSPEVKINPHQITIKDQSSNYTFDITDYEVVINKNGFPDGSRIVNVKSVTINFIFRNGDARFYHDLSDRKYYFYIYLRESNISMACSNDEFSRLFL
jgi:hypothetical protein